MSRNWSYFALGVDALLILTGISLIAFHSWLSTSAQFLILSGVIGLFSTVSSLRNPDSQKFKSLKQRAEARRKASAITHNP